MPAYQPGESIEGVRIRGHSRKPLRYQRTYILENKIKHHIFKAEFNVFAEIDTALVPDAVQLDINALTNVGETLGCDSAIITSLYKKYHSDLGSNVTATHSANLWEFVKQTNVRVTIPREEIINGLNKRPGMKPAVLSGLK